MINGIPRPVLWRLAAVILAIGILDIALELSR